MKNTVIYARGNDAIGISIPSQIFLCKRFAVNNNYTVVKVFTDNNASEKVKDRPLSYQNRYSTRYRQFWQKTNSAPKAAIPIIC